MDRFIMVVPTGEAMNALTDQWVHSELQHANEHWRRQFRGEPAVRRDVDITDADIASSNLILWGDPSSNKILQRILKKLPVRWDEQIRVRYDSFVSSRHVLAMIYPNPENPKRYVVLNSGFTFREFDYLNNARQAPKLPDWAIIDVTSPRTSQKPGGIADAGFFNDSWRISRKGEGSDQ
jgi:hypothetical protein